MSAELGPDFLKRLPSTHNQRSRRFTTTQRECSSEEWCSRHEAGCNVLIPPQRSQVFIDTTLTPALGLYIVLEGVPCTISSVGPQVDSDPNLKKNSKRTGCIWDQDFNATAEGLNHGLNIDMNDTSPLPPVMLLITFGVCAVVIMTWSDGMEVLPTHTHTHTLDQS